MGTRSLTHIRGDDNEGILVTLYRQMDGYPEGMGADLKAIVADVTLTNGFSGAQKLPKFANGMGCLAAYIVGKLKNCGNHDYKKNKRVPGWSIGSIYLQPPGASDCGEEYVYTLYAINDRVGIKVESAGWSDRWHEVKGKYVERAKPIYHPPVILYDGLAADFDPKACAKVGDAA
jgi:hypothetical protein